MTKLFVVLIVLVAGLDIVAGCILGALDEILTEIRALRLGAWCLPNEWPRVRKPWEGDETTFNVVKRRTDDGQG
jgi:hypothetical protein